jgi:rhamnosyltransferase
MQPAVSTNRSTPALKRAALIVPTLNAERHLHSLLPALGAQGIGLDRILFIDSSSDDGTAEQVRRFGARLHVIPREAFNHGGTRRLAAELRGDADYLIFLTQDAVPADANAVATLLRAFDQPGVGVAYGRQLPRAQAAPIEIHARLMNYPPQSALRSLRDKDRFGVKLAFNSDSFAAYARDALQAVGGFPEDAFFGEDQIVAGKMLLDGYSIAYVAEASVTHSHGYSIADDFRRYFDIGIFHSRNHWLIESFGRAEGEGRRFVLSELRYLLRRAPWLIPSAIGRTLAKYMAYRLGAMEQSLPPGLKLKLSASAYYWKSRSQ